MFKADGLDAILSKNPCLQEALWRMPVGRSFLKFPWQPDLAADIALDRMAEAEASGAEAVITACPRCVQGLAKADKAVKVYDLTVAIAGSMGIEF